MAINTKSKILLYFLLITGILFSNSINDLSSGRFNSSSNLLSINKLNHNFSISMGVQTNNFGSSSYYSIGDRVTYNFSEKLSFIGDFNIITSSLNLNQFDQINPNPELNYNLGLRYKLNKNSNIDFRIIKNSSNYQLGIDPFKINL
tara:strand:+ start:414 stop:851 length:438 start_codon:yes stop_codon:yes gene_type:complete